MGCRHGFEALSWSADLAQSAAEWAESCPGSGGNPPHVRPNGSSSYSLIPGRGENVAAGQKKPEDAVGDWYNEIWEPGYVPGTKGTGTGHYTALIWKMTKEVGCAQNECYETLPNPVHVCHYGNQPPNFGGTEDFVANVPQ